MLTLVLGGSRSGKSRIAEQIARRSGGSIHYIATGVATDDEMAARIATHRARRPAEWVTVEAPLALSSAVDRIAKGTVLIDSATVWLGNLLFAAGEDPSDEAIRQVRREVESQVAALVAWSRASDRRLIVVSDEVGSGVVPAFRSGRIFRDVLGEVNQRLAAHADHAVLVVAGIPVDLRKLEWQPE